MTAQFARKFAEKVSRGRDVVYVRLDVMVNVSNKLLYFSKYSNFYPDKCQEKIPYSHAIFPVSSEIRNVFFLIERRPQPLGKFFS